MFNGGGVVQQLWILCYRTYRIFFIVMYSRDPNARGLLLTEGWYKFLKIKERGGPFYIKVQSVMELLLFTESQNLSLLRKYGASKFGGITRYHTKYGG